MCVCVDQSGMCDIDGDIESETEIERVSGRARGCTNYMYYFCARSQMQCGGNISPKSRVRARQPASHNDDISPPTMIYGIWPACVRVADPSRFKSARPAEWRLAIEYLVCSLAHSLVERRPTVSA